VLVPLRESGAAASILAGVGLALVIQLAGGARPSLPQSGMSGLRLTIVRAPVIAAVAVLAVPSVRVLRADAQAMDREAAGDNSLVHPIKAAGRRAAVLPCGTPATGSKRRRSPGGLASM
jgi:hypothetical protein